MKKIIALLVLVGMIFSVCLAGCGQQSQIAETSQPSEYGQLHQVESNVLMENTIIHEGLTEVLPDLKTLVRDSLSEKDYLNWEQFETVSEIREFKSPELVGNFAETTAFYPAGTHIIVVCPKFFTIGNGDQQTYSLAHELVHSLTGVGKSGEEASMNLFMEGITDYLTNSMLVDTNLKYVPTYQNELYCIAWLAALYGDDGIAKTICGGKIISFIDKQAGKTGTGASLHNVLATLDKSNDQEEVRDAILAEISILQTISGENTEVSEKFTEIFKAAYAPYLN